MLSPPSLRFTSTYHTSAVGHLAFNQLSQTSAGRIIGSTSRGFFILSAAQRVIFVSYEAERGPLTVNLADPPQQPLPVTIGQEVQLEPDEIIIPDLGSHLLIEHNLRWSPPIPPGQSAPLDAVDRVLRQIVRVVMEKKRGSGFVPLLAFIFDLPARPTVPISLQPSITNVIILKQQLLARPFTESLGQIKDFMGLGRGLTPSGDDLICGLLLVLNRLPEKPVFQPQLAEFNEQVVELAFSKTTSLSASLIEAASMGSADERLIRAFDGLLTGELSPEDILTSLEAYGSSSGIDALAGASIVFQALIDQAAQK